MSNHTPSNTTRSMPTSKLEKFLTQLLNVGLNGLHTLSVTKVSNDTPHSFWTSCLRDDVYKLRSRHGIELDSKVDPFFSQNGYRVNFKRYWLPNRLEAQKALDKLNSLKTKRGDTAISNQQAEQLLCKFD